MAGWTLQRATINIWLYCEGSLAKTHLAVPRAYTLNHAEIYRWFLLQSRSCFGVKEVSKDAPCAVRIPTWKLRWRRCMRYNHGGIWTSSFLGLERYTTDQGEKGSPDRFSQIFSATDPHLWICFLLRTRFYVASIFSLLHNLLIIGDISNRQTRKSGFSILRYCTMCMLGFFIFVVSPRILLWETMARLLRCHKSLHNCVINVMDQSSCTHCNRKICFSVSGLHHFGWIGNPIKRRVWLALWDLR